MIRFFTLVLSFTWACFANELAIVALVKNEGAYLDEWIYYHRLVGVEHFYLYDNGSEDNTLEVLEPYIREGVVELVDWPSNPGDDNHVAAQVKAYKNGLRKAVGTYKWVALIDADEYLFPRKDKTVPECLEKWFSEADAVYINWRHFGTSWIEIPQGQPILDRLVRSSYFHHARNIVGKSIVKPEKVEISKIWYVHHCVLKPGCHYVDGCRNVMDNSGDDLRGDGKHYDRLLILHHYGHRDERYYHNIRVPRNQKRYGSIELTEQHYIDFNRQYNNSLVAFLKRMHPEAYKDYWQRN